MTLLDVKNFHKKFTLDGSSDGGFTIHNDDPNLNKMMRTAARRLNLQGHWILDSGVKIYGPGDIGN